MHCIAAAVNPSRTQTLRRKLCQRPSELQSYQSNLFQLWTSLLSPFCFSAPDIPKTCRYDPFEFYTHEHGHTNNSGVFVCGFRPVSLLCYRVSSFLEPNLGLSRAETRGMDLLVRILVRRHCRTRVYVQDRSTPQGIWYVFALV